MWALHITLTIQLEPLVCGFFFFFFTQSIYKRRHLCGFRFHHLLHRPPPLRGIRKLRLRDGAVGKLEAQLELLGANDLFFSWDR